jgi:hypothetical protein
MTDQQDTAATPATPTPDAPAATDAEREWLIDEASIEWLRKWHAEIRPFDGSMLDQVRLALVSMFAKQAADAERIRALDGALRKIEARVTGSGGFTHRERAVFDIARTALAARP